MILFARKWESLTKYQKAFILKLMEGKVEGSLNAIMNDLGFKNNGMKFNESVYSLIDLKIVTVKETDKKSRGKCGKIFEYELNDEWCNILLTKR